MCFLQTFCVLESKHHAFCRLREVFAPSVLAGRALRAAYCRFLLASLQLAHIFPEVQRPKADAVLQLRSCQFPGERKDFSLCLGSVYDPVQCVFSFSPAEQRRAACSAPGVQPVSPTSESCSELDPAFLARRSSAFRTAAPVPLHRAAVGNPAGCVPPPCCRSSSPSLGTVLRPPPAPWHFPLGCAPLVCFNRSPCRSADI